MISANAKPQGRITGLVGVLRQSQKLEPSKCHLSLTTPYLAIGKLSIDRLI